MIIGIIAGAATPNVFEADPSPTGTMFPTGTTFSWSADDTNVVLAPSTTNPSQVMVSTPASDKSTSFKLSVTVQMPGAAALSASVDVPITPAPVPLPTGVLINQIS